MSAFTWSCFQFLIPFLAFFVFVVVWMFPLLLYLERKVSAHIQDRRGPNRAHVLGIRLFGAVHGLADLIKLLHKEDTKPHAADPFLFRLAPFLVLLTALMTMAAIPFAPTVKLGDTTYHLTMQIAPLNAGILYVFAMFSLSVYGVVLAGWSSGNKFAFLSALRAASQMISFKLGLGLSVVGILAAYGTTDLALIVQRQGVDPSQWGIWISPVGCLIFVVCLLAETNRAPFDLTTTDAELAGGYRNEYSGLRYALFSMGEYLMVILGAAVIATLFLGGWQVPFLTTTDIHESATEILTIAALAGGLLLLLISALLFRVIAKPRHKRGDLSDHEPKYFVPLALFGGLGLVYLAGWIMPDVVAGPWMQTLTQLGLQLLAFAAKTFLVAFTFIWVRWSTPRVRYDQAMRLGWQWLVPLGVANIFLTTFWARLWL